MSALLDRIEMMRTPDRFGSTCTRFSHIEGMDQEKRQTELELNHWKMLEQRSADRLVEKLSLQMGWSIEKTRKFFRGENEPVPSPTE